MNNTLVKGMALLEAIASSEGASGVTELARRVGIGKSNTHRLLQALVELGYVSRNEQTGTYTATLRLWEMGYRVLANFDLRRVAEPWMRKLLKATRENVHLAILDGNDVVYVHKFDSPEPLRTFSRVGGRAPAYAAATGKAILAWRSPGYLEALLKRLERHSPTTIVEPDRFRSEMRRIRERGYAISNGEWRENIRGIAAPIFEPRGTVVAALGLSGPTERLSPARVKALVPMVVNAAAAIAGEMADAAPTARVGRN